MKNEKRSTVTRTYDELNRLKDISYPDSTQNVTFTYDQGTFGMGRRTGMSDPSGATAFRYDFKGRMVEKTATVFSQSYSVQTAYTNAGRINQVTYPSGRTVDYARNSCVCRIDGVTTTTAGGNTRTVLQNLTYRPFAGPKGMDNGGGTVDNIHDQFGRISIANAGASKERTYSYDGNSNLTAVTAAAPARHSQSFGFDALNRLNSFRRSNYEKIDFTYDDVGNRQTRTANGSTATYSYTAGTNRLAQVSTPHITYTVGYDNNGNITAMDNRTFTYNQSNRLVRVAENGTTLGQYTYNALGQRIIKVAGGTTTIFHYDLEGNLIGESDVGGTFTSEYLYQGKQVLAKVSVDIDRMWFYHNSQLGAPQAMADGTGTIVWEGLYRPFGNAFVNPYSTEVNNLRYNGQYYDAETGLHYNHYRYYDPKLGRYLRADPIGLAGGINPYAYVQNNPVNYFDPYGLEGEPVRLPKVIVKQNGVTIYTHGSADAHRTAHAHVKGQGPHTRIGPIGKELHNNPKMSSQQNKVYKDNWRAVRNELNKLGRVLQAIDKLKNVKINFVIIFEPQLQAIDNMMKGRPADWRGGACPDI